MASQNGTPIFSFFLIFGRAHDGPCAGYDSAPTYEYSAIKTVRGDPCGDNLPGFFPPKAGVQSIFDASDVSDFQSFFYTTTWPWLWEEQQKSPPTCGRGRTADSHLEGSCASHNSDVSMARLIGEDPDDSPRVMCPYSSMYLPGEFSSSEPIVPPLGGGECDEVQ